MKAAICPSCGKYNLKESPICSQCGAVLSDPGGDEAQDGKTGALSRKPALLSILAVLSIMSGFFTITQPFRNPGLAGQLGISPERFFTGYGLIGGLGLLSGYLILRGNPRGWWLATIFYSFAALRNMDEICIFTGMATSMPTNFLTVLVVESLLTIGALLALGYMFSEDVRAYLGLRSGNKKRMAVIIGLVSFGLVTLLQIVDLIL